MWVFRHKRTKQETVPPNPSCPFCASINTRLVLFHGTNRPDYVKVWRGQRSLTYRCLACGRDFYATEPPGGVNEEAMAENQEIDDEEALRAAEEDLKRQTEEDDDRRCL